MSDDQSVMIHFDRCAPYLEAALKYTNGDFTLEEVRERCENGEMQFWPAARGCVVTSVAVYPRTKVLVIFLVAGDPDEWPIIWPAIASWGKSIGCSRATTHGRPGWLRHRKAHLLGFIPQNEVVLEASLDG